MAGLCAAGLFGPVGAAWSQGALGPPSVGVQKVERRPITETSEFIGRIQAMTRVDVVARVTAYLEQVVFRDGAEVKAGDLLYKLEQAPFEADVAAKQASVDQFKAQLQNAQITLDRSQSLLKSAAGMQSTVDSALAAQRSLAAQMAGAQATLKTSQINLDYTTIKAPISGQIGRTAVTAGNVVGPNSGVLTTIVGQDPMYVVFPISVRSGIDLREKYGDKGFKAVVIRIKLPDGRIYSQTGKLDFVDNTIAAATDTIILRGVIPNPPLPNEGDTPTASPLRELADGEFVSVMLEGVEPIEVLAVPRGAILTDQQGDYVYVIDAQNKAQRQAVKLGQSTPSTASIIDGLKEGQMVVVEGLQRVRPGQAVSPSPATPGPVSPDAPKP